MNVSLMLLILVAYLQDSGVLGTVKSVLGPVETLVCLVFVLNSVSIHNCVPLPKQCLGLLTVNLYQFNLKKSLAGLQWLCDKTEKLTVLFVPQMQRLT